MAKIVKKSLRIPVLPASAPSADNQLTPRTTADNLLSPRSAGASTHRLQSVLNSSTTPNNIDDTAVRLLSTFQAIFDKADTDGSGSLDVKELADVIRKCYRAKETSRSATVVRREIALAMETYDTDGSGTLELIEFLSMVMSPTHFKFRVQETMVTAVLAMAQGEDGAALATARNYSRLRNRFSGALRLAERNGWSVSTSVSVCTEVEAQVEAQGLNAVDAEGMAMSRVECLVQKFKLKDMQRIQALNRVVSLMTNNQDKAQRISAFTSWTLKASESLQTEYDALYNSHYLRAMLVARKYEWSTRRCVEAGKQFKVEFAEKGIEGADAQAKAAIDIVAAAIKLEKINEQKKNWATGRFVAIIGGRQGLSKKLAAVECWVVAVREAHEMTLEQEVANKNSNEKAKR